MQLHLFDIEVADKKKWKLDQLPNEPKQVFEEDHHSSWTISDDVKSRQHCARLLIAVVLLLFFYVSNWLRVVNSYVTYFLSLDFH